MHCIKETLHKEKFPVGEESVHQHTLVLLYKTMVSDSFNPPIPIRTGQVGSNKLRIPYPLQCLSKRGGELLASARPQMGRGNTMVVPQITSHPNLPAKVIGEVHSHQAIGQAACQSTIDHLQGGLNHTIGSIDIQINADQHRISLAAMFPYGQRYARHTTPYIAPLGSTVFPYGGALVGYRS